VDTLVAHIEEANYHYSPAMDRVMQSKLFELLRHRDVNRRCSAVPYTTVVHLLVVMT
jgi:hypothetical protein